MVSAPVSAGTCPQQDSHASTDASKTIVGLCLNICGPRPIPALSKHRGRPVGMLCLFGRAEGHGLPGCRDFQPKQSSVQEITLLPGCCEAQHPSSQLSHGKQPSKDTSSRVVCRSEELKLRPQALRKFLDKVRACAADEGAHMLLQSRATEFTAFLRFREKVWTAPCSSCFLFMVTGSLRRQSE